MDVASHKTGAIAVDGEGKHHITVLITGESHAGAFLAIPVFTAPGHMHVTKSHGYRRATANMHAVNAALDLQACDVRRPDTAG